jgi:hypothetical protein
MKPNTKHQRLAQAEASHLLGLPSDEAENMLHRMQTDFYTLESQEYSDLLRATGFNDPTNYFKTLRFQGFHAQKEANI